MTKNIKTVSDFDLQEKETRSELKKMTEKAELLKVKRNDLLLVIGDGDNTLKKDLNQLEEERKELAIEIEIAESLLSAIPRRRNLARADEIELNIKEIQKLDDQINGVAASIDQAADAFVQNVRKYFDILEDLHAKNPHGFPRGLGIAVNVLNSIGFYLRKYSLWGWVTAGDFRNATSMVEGLEVNHARRAIRVLLNGMSETAARLRGEKTKGEERCPICFGNIGMDHTTGNKSCQRCGAII